SIHSPKKLPLFLTTGYNQAVNLDFSLLPLERAKFALAGQGSWARARIAEDRFCEGMSQTYVSNLFRRAVSVLSEHELF
ncbi:hypothetical protein NW868_06315, partial [Synechococcus sp. R60.2]